MNSLSASVSRFHEYLSKARRRERWRHTLAFVAVGLLVLSVLTLAGAWLGLYRGFTPLLDLGIRSLLVVSAIVCLILLLWRPLRRLASDEGASLVESSDAAFDGRVNTFLDTSRSDPSQPFLSLLARDALSIARRVPLHRVVPTSALVWPVLLLLALTAGVAGFVKTAPPAWQNAALHVWWGWKDPSLVDPRVVSVMPGSIELLAGEDLQLDATLFGFEAETVTLHVRKDGEEQWQTSEILASPDKQFRFTIFRVSAPLSYYVEAGFTRSEEFAVSVIQPARLQSIDVEYVYPEWTNLPDTRQEDVTTISAVKNTAVTVSFSLDKPLNDGLLMLGDTPVVMRDIETSEGARYEARFIVQNDTEYQLMDTMLGRQIAISSAHAVVVRGDEAPEVKFLSPGRDVSASPIEEVAISVEATDDFAIESVELLYSVNAGPWQTVVLDELPVAGHTFYLETLGESSVVNEPVVEDDAAIDQEPGESSLPATTVEAASSGPMEPGDLISYYVRVRDHNSVSETDMMLVDVRPFERRFSEGQGAAAGGGGGGGGAADEGSEISQRQKEIFLATWNLQRSKEAAGGDATGHEDNARLLSELQRTLAEQARTLADRSEARELVNQGEEIRQFVEYLREAAEQMEPSALALDQLAFNDAIQPQQKALQLLQRAEALFADIRMTQQEGQGGQGQQAGQDMAEIFELEMDLERNQYEQPDRGGNNGGGEEQLDDIFEELAELARRQLALAEAERQRESLTREEQWEQQQLARELEELRRELEQLERDAAGAEGAEAERLQQAAGELSERLEQAQEALEQSQEALEQSEPSADSGTEESDSSAQDDTRVADNGETDADAQQSDELSATQSASEALQEALEALGEARSEDLQSGIDLAAEQAAVLLDDQRDLEEEIREMVESLVRRRESGVMTRGPGREEVLDLADRKRTLQRELENLRDDVEALEDRFGAQAPQTGEALAEAIERLDESRAAEILGIAGDSIANGSLATVLPGESLVTNALREWRDRLSEAGETAASEELQIRDNQDLQVADALQQLQELREQLGGGQQGQSGGQGQVDDQQAQGEQPGREGQQGQGNQQAQGDQPGQEGQQGQGSQQAQGDQPGQEGEQGQGSQQAQGDQQGQEGQQGQGSQQAEGGQQGQEGQQGQGSQQAQGGQQGQEGQQGQGSQQAQGGQQGQEGQQGQGSQQAQGGQQGQSGQQGQAGQQGQGNQQAQGSQQGQEGQPGPNGGSQGTGIASTNQSWGGRQDGQLFERSAEQTAEALENLAPRLDAAGVSDADIEAIRDSARRLRDGDGEINAARVEAEFRNVLRQIEQLEIQLSNTASSDANNVDALVRQGEVSDAAADYYRRLSEQPVRIQR